MSGKKKNKKTGVPDRWLDYAPVGCRIPGTRFIAFKVPLKPSLNCLVPESDSFGLWQLLDSVRSQDQDLGLIIDLTFTTRYYQPSDIPQSCCYVKIRTEGHRVPADADILSFKRAVTHFLDQNHDNDKLIGVHCTHGLNRTGYLVCRYLIDVDGLEPAAAVELFNACRGHRIERKNYLLDLKRGAKRSNAGIQQPEEEPIRGLAVKPPPGPAQRPPCPAQQSPSGSAQRPPGPAQKSASGPAQRPPGPAQRPPGPAQRPPGPAQRPPGPAQRPPGPAQRPPGPAQRPPGPAQRPPGPAQKSPLGPAQRPSAPAQIPPGPAPAKTPPDTSKESLTPGENRPPGNRRRRGARHRRGNKPQQGSLPPAPPLPAYQWSPAPS
ncbi:RNA/RNP complex-1-interacting phosphatase-like isoform X1 [Scomber scombrus]|uniref:RNA/RNP complex-1-interacting phosphatase-like isoform X1 n=1 Tax=Scomber scombrus TaxID=13677 RepID=UPI002DDB510A|nr:RNA/RNP complex-1-interacting phosphatase-like isoform X1 [Scomber scombrus]XP_062291801.1 RNA/RNP complex-1-interacting phosphatase-like isoform X1 [Scomber scombrus]